MSCVANIEINAFLFLQNKEKRWCAECEHSDCKKDDNVVIKECDDGKRDQRWIFGGRKIRSYVSDDLCITARSGLDGYVSLRTCSSDGDKYQEFDLSDNIFKKFQIRPRDEDDLCLTQDHHPKVCSKDYGQDIIKNNNLT